ncbi:MAG: glycosyl hydrolase [Thermoanaerobaculia bacterium]|nr:glycosyl hydrolase [Thermoanaerobaculia bacterium]
MPRALVIALTCLVLLPLLPADVSAREPADGASKLNEETLRGLALRSVGPALMGGRIADIAIDSRRRSTWYLAVGSGGVWKTENAGVTWTPLFDDQPSYSVGCVTLDPTRPDVVWVGTGENVSGRHVGWGDGVYKSADGGQTWQHMGLEQSEHIGDIVVDPRDGDVVYVAAEGPLWASGGERGLFKTTDGGASWERLLEIDDDTGVTDLEMDPRNPDVLYAATYQRRRHVWSHLAGGPGSGVHKSEDGGRTWQRLSVGLPSGDMGKIGLALSPADPDVLYATIEASEEERGFYRSTDAGGSWQKRNSYISNGTGPHYYQEIVASPHDVDRVYQMDVFLHVTRDGGATFEILGDGRQKHSDNHALVIDPEDPDHLLAGSDASLYETFDHGATWRQFPNLPISQFYKLAVDNAEPFYNILGGAQDLGTLFGPSRTTNVEGVRNRDWYVPLGADGYACAFDPELPHVMYLQWQVGRLYRYDRLSEEALDIQPQPAPGDPPERWNWDAPLITSPHAAGRLYFGSQRLWRSDDRGNSWRPVSEDLTRGRNRYELEMLDRVWSVDSLYDNGAMSWYATLTAISESPLVEGLLYAGTDDGLIQVSEDGGATWRRAGTPQGVPDTAFVNDVVASLHDPNTVFAAYDAHKTGDFRPLVFESRDRGRTWRPIAGKADTTGLPTGHVVWSMVQDHVVADLLFAGTEFGVFFTADRGRSWVKLAGGVPTIAFRDLALQRRDDDLVGATFGRGFYVLDDYAPLRDMASGALDADAHLFPVRDAWWYVPSEPMQAAGQPSLGSDAFTADNPPFGAVVTYYLKTSRQTAREARREGEQELRDDGEDVPFPGWERLADEELEIAAKVLVTIRDADGVAVRRLEGPAKAGIHRVAWDLRRPPPNPVDLTSPGFRPPWASDPRGPLVAPGRYRAELAVVVGGQIEPLDDPQEFEVKAVPGTSLPTPDFEAVAAFQQETAELLRRVQGASAELRRTSERLRHLRAALAETPTAPDSLFERVGALEADLVSLRTRLTGDRLRWRWNEPTTPSILGRVGQVAGGHWDTRQAPTATHRRNLEIAASEFAAFLEDVEQLLGTTLPGLESDFEEAGAPWTPSRRLPSHP